jgi:hypothetical protein
MSKEEKQNISIESLPHIKAKKYGYFESYAYGCF